jgi:hypothetical protein
MTFPFFRRHPKPDHLSPSLPSEAGDEDDALLVTFLRQHRPQIPGAAPGLEDQIMQAVATPSRRSAPRTQRPSQSWWRTSWAMPTAMAASVLVSWVGYRLSIPAQPSAAELAQLESFMESGWDGTVDTNSYEEAFLPLTPQ